MRRGFHDELQALEGEILHMGSLVEESLAMVLKALAARDEGIAGTVIDNDDFVDQKYVEIEHRILGLLARQAPVAGDLRLISGILHINIHLERMGDLCVNMAKFVRLPRDFLVNPQMQETLEERGARAKKMIAASLQAFAQRDLELALNLPRMDDSLDRMNKQMFKEIAASAGDERMLDWASRMVMVSRYLERLGDHAVDIGEQVAFIVTGEIREFTGEPASSREGRPPSEASP